MAAKMKKVESSYSFLGSRLLLPLIILVLATMTILDGEKYSSLLSTENHYTKQSSSVDVSAVSLHTNDNNGANKEQDSSAIEETGKSEGGFTFQAINSSVSFPPQENENSGDVTYKSPPVCNYGNGRWVEDSRRPLYSGTGCKRWLSGMWACRLTTRTDFSYERYRWQPKNCDLPEFDPTTFLRRMQDKTIAFIGDSIGRQQFQSLMCMASGGRNSSNVENVGMKYGLVKPPGSIRPNGHAYRFSNTNTTILYYWSACLADLEPINKTDPKTKIAMHLDRPPAFLRKFINRFDIVVLNTGHHWNKGKFRANRWKSYVNGMPVEDGELTKIGNAKKFTIHRIIKWLDSQVSVHPRLKAFFRTISPRHFFHGEWNTGGSCDNTIPLTHGSEVQQDRSSDQVVEAAVNKTRVNILDITTLSALRDEAHISRYSSKVNHSINDCLHWCLPGIPDTWNELLVAQI